MAGFNDIGRRGVKRALAKGGLTIGRFPNRLGGPYSIMHIIETFDGDGVLDVGANRGQFGLMLRESGYRGPLLSFEPVSEAHRELAAHALADPRWSTRPLALGDSPGTLKLNVAQSSSVSSFLEPTEWYASEYDGVALQRSEEVRVATLQEISAEIPFQRPFLKIDTQGYDLRVLAGAGAFLDRVIGVQIEMSVIPIYKEMPSYVMALTTMHDLGFTPAGIFPVAVDEKLRVYEFDGVFVRQ